MELDRDLVNQINSMRDDELAGAIGRIAAAMGLSPEMVKPYLGDTARIRAIVGNLTQEDMDRIVGKLGEGETMRLVSEIRRETGEA